MTRPYDVSGQPNKRIVVIDDDPSVQEVVRAYLEKDGYHVFVAGTATEGLRLAERIKPGLVVLDLMLPYLSVRVRRSW